MSERKIRPATKAVAAHDVEGLKAKTMAQCEEEFATKWGEPFHKPGGARGVGTWVLELWAADVANKQIEDEARELYEKLRKRLVRVAEEAQAFRTRPAGPGGLGDVPFSAGGVAVQMLWFIEHQIAKFRPISEHEQQLAASVPGMGESYRRTEGRAAFVARFVSEAARFPMQATVSNRDVAVASILCGAGPDGWAAYANALREGELVTPAKVIEAEETRVRRIRSALDAEASGSGSASQ